MDAHRWPAVAGNLPSDVVDAFLRLDKDDRFALLFGHNFAQQNAQFGFLLKLLTNVDDLQNVVVGRQLQRTHVDLYVILEIVLDEPGHGIRPSRGPHQRLMIRTDLSNYCPNLWLETHVQHPIGFIQHQIRATTQIGVPRGQKIV